MSTESGNPRAPAGANAPEFSVSELSGAIKRALEDGFGHVRLRGEVSGYRGPHASGHCYFSLKDDKAKIEAVIWRGAFQKLRVKPEEGMEVVAEGRITTYPGSSKYQIVIEQIAPAGLGALMALLEERKRKLAAEGLFAEERKRPLPFLPRVVGIVTSPTGAVIRDMLAGFAERFPTHVIVWPVRVQGEGSAAEVAAAVKGFNALAGGGAIPRPDVLIVARGGGSLEDLWSFNEEVVVRAVAESAIPVISAVGHETDWTLIDLVADSRAPTPTKAAEWAVPKYSELTEETLKLGLRLAVALRRVVEQQRAHWRAAARGLPRREDLLAMPRQKFNSVERRLGRALVSNTRAHHLRHVRVASRLSPRLVVLRIERVRDRLEGLARRAGEGLGRNAGQRRSRYERIAGRLSPVTFAVRLTQTGERAAMLGARAARAFANLTQARRRRLEALAQLAHGLSHESALQRGFVLVRDSDGRMLRRALAIAPGSALELQFSDGRIQARAAGGPDGGGGTGRGAATGASGDADSGAASAVRARTTVDGGAGAPPATGASAARRRHRDGGQGTLF